MKKHILLVALAAWSLSGVRAIAQTGQTGSSSVAADQSRGSRHEMVTVVGCLKQGGSGAETGSTGSSSSSSSSATGNNSRTDSGYMLTNAHLNSGRGGNSPSASSTPPSSASTAPTGGESGSNRASSQMRGGVYSLTGLSDSELKQHVNHQVEVTGRIENGRDGLGSSGATSSTGAPSSSATSSSAGGSRSMDIDHATRLHASSLKMISSTCSAGTE